MRNKLLKILAQVILLICCLIIFEKQVYGGDAIYLENPTLYILSIGIDEYESDKIRLKLAKNDAQAIADEFEKRGKYKYTKIEKIVLLDKNATRVNILSQLESIAKKATKADVFIFAYSGWGNSFVDEFYLYPFDSKDNSNKALETNISNSTLQAYFRKIRANSKLVILDSGPFLIDRTKIEAVFSDENILANKDKKLENFLLIGSDTTSIEIVRLKHGSITHNLLEGLKGSADYNNDGEFSFREIEASLYLNSIQYTAKYSNNFHPTTIIKNDFNIAFTDKELVRQGGIAKITENLKNAKSELNDFIKKRDEVQSFIKNEEDLKRSQDVLLGKFVLFGHFLYPLVAENDNSIKPLKELPDLIELTEKAYDNLISVLNVKSLKIRKKDNAILVEKQEVSKLVNKRIKELASEIAKFRQNSLTDLQKLFALQQNRDKIQNTLDKMLGRTTETNQTRSDVLILDEDKKNEGRIGDDYAILFANENYDHPSWRKLKNPFNDVETIAKELKEIYGFKEVEIKKDLNTLDIYKTIQTYQDRKFEKPQDQLFIFFAGHGYADEENNGYYIGKDSPSAQSLNTFENRRIYESKFVQLDTLLKGVDRIKINHIMVVFDACFAGKIWQPAIQLIEETAEYQPKTNPFEFALGFNSFGQGIGSSFNFVNHRDDVEPLVYAKKKMKNKSRIVLTSGDKPVYDSWIKADGTLSDHSPFADAFIRALQTKGNDDKVLITPEFIPFIDKLEPQPQRGKLSGSDGDFVFVLSEQKPNSPQKTPR